jgi:TolB-like protein
VKLLAELRRRNVLRAAIAYVVTAWVIVESSSLLLTIFKAPDWAAQTIVFMLVAGFPVAVAFAWMFEITPEGIKPDHEVSGDTDVSAASSRYLVMTTIVMAMIAAGLFAVDRFLIEEDTAPAPRNGPPVVAVLPFEVVGSADGAFLADGLHHDLLTRLSKLRAFAVISRTSMLEYRGTTRNMRDIGKELAADFILEGGVQFAGNRVRVHAQLIDTEFDEHRWGDSYDRELTATDLFAIQSDLATDIAAQLELTLSRADRAQMAQVPTRSTEAYTAYLSGLAMLNDPGLGQERGLLAHRQIEKAVALDPTFVEAWTQFVRHSRFWTVIWQDRDTMMAAVSAALENVRRLGPGSYDAGIAEIYYLYFALNEFDAVLPAIAALEARGALGPDALNIRAKALRREGRIDEAYRSYLASARLDPRSLNTSYDLYQTAIMLRDCRRAELHAKAMLAIAPRDMNARSTAADYELQCTGDWEHAGELVRGYESTSDNALWAALDAAAVARDWARAIELLEQGELLYDWWGDRVQDQLLIVLLLRRLGRDAESDAVLDAIETAIGANEPPARSSFRDDAYEGIRMRYAALRGDDLETRRWSDALSRSMQDASALDPIARAAAYRLFAFEFAAAGQADRAIDALELMFAGPSFVTFRYVDAHPAFDDLRDNPRYAELKQRYDAPIRGQ